MNVTAIYVHPLVIVQPKVIIVLGYIYIVFDGDWSMRNTEVLVVYAMIGCPAVEVRLTQSPKVHDDPNDWKFNAVDVNVK